jgi:ribonuclease PH
VLVSFGDTQVICAVTIENKVPRWMMQQNVSGGWLTAEYNMLPYSTLERKSRDIALGRLDGRSSEIQRLIGRSLRAVVDLKALGARTIWVDCDVLRADGGTRTASISGACVAAEMAFRRMVAAGVLKVSPLKQLACAISAGVCQGKPMLDLNYPEDRDASVDFNYVMTETLDLIEVQGTGEEATFTESQMMQMLELSKSGARQITARQRGALAGFDPAVDEAALARLRQ